MGEEEASEGAMAALLFLAPLLLLGTVGGQAQAQTAACLRLGSAAEGNFSVDTAPQTYSANTTYVGKPDCTNISGSNSAALLTSQMYLNWGMSNILFLS